jgi:CRISPR-associated protein Cas1
LAIEFVNMRNNAAWIFKKNDSIPVSHRDPLVYLEASRVNVEDGRVVYWASQRGSSVEYAFNFPALNTAVLLLGPGCSITSDAVELLCAANVVIGFTGSGGYPISGGVEAEDVHFVAGASEYRPTRYMQAWVALWMDPEKRLSAARSLLVRRNTEMEAIWKLSPMKPYLENVSAQNILSAVSTISTGSRACRGGMASRPTTPFAQKVLEAKDEQALLGLEGARVKNLYQKFAAAHHLVFERDQSERHGVNGKLTMGNYMAYGLAASALYALGISFAFPLLYGKTRRGGLVFDLADVVKDAIVVPVAFAMRDASDSEFRQALKTAMMDVDGLKRLIDIATEICACS